MALEATRANEKNRLNEEGRERAGWHSESLAVGVAVASLLILSACGHEDPDVEVDGAVEESALEGGSVEYGYGSVVELLLSDGQFRCTATLVAEKTALTAAHCVWPIRSIPGRGRSYGGHASCADDLQADCYARRPPSEHWKCAVELDQCLEYQRVWYIRAGGKEYRGYAVHHPEYPKPPPANQDYSYDIAIIRLERRVSGVAPTRVSSAPPKSHWPVTLLGFGTTQSSSTLVKRRGYSRISPPREGVSEREIVLATGAIAGDPVGAVGCGGDSGGPTFVGNGAASEATCQIGVHSRAGCRPGGQTIDIRTDLFRKWVEDNMEYSPFGSNDMRSCDPRQDLGRPLFHWYNQSSTDHFYSLAANPANWSHPGFAYWGITAYLMPTSAGGAHALHRFYAPAPRSTHIYSGRAEAAPGGSEYNYLVSLGFQYEGIEGYVFPSPRPLMVPLHRLSWWDPAKGDGAHLMTPYEDIKNNFVNGGWKYNRVEGYVYAPLFGL